jgi:putative endonuclease
MLSKYYYVYIMTNVSGTLYIGITSNLQGRVYQHRKKVMAGFTARYNITRLVYIETFDHPSDAIAREKQLKRWGRAKKIKLIESTNPSWDDLGPAVLEG